MTSLIDALWHKLSIHLGTEFATLVLTIVGSAIVWPLLTCVWGRLLRVVDFLKSRRRALGAVARIDGAGGSREGRGVWTLGPITHPENYKSNIRASRILAVANLKGGVGKTTIAANIAAHLAHDEAWKKRVLLVDLDYQGSLSSMAFPDDQSWLPPKGADSIASRALSGDVEPSLFLQACKQVKQTPNLQVVTAHYDLAQADNRLLVEWLLNKRGADPRPMSRKIADLILGRNYQPCEMRYNLAKLLHSDAVRENFDLIIIDCPPRLTAGAIQAFCASSHLLIPTLLDRPSGESVVSFCEQIEAMKASELCPHLSYVGIVASRYVAQQRGWRVTLAEVEDQMRARRVDCGFLPLGTFIPQTVAFTQNSEDGIGYYSLGGSEAAVKAKMAVAALAEHVAAQVGVPKTPNFNRNLQLVFPVAAE
jgi:cellulose biosynthesis protein BcsQ